MKRSEVNPIDLDALDLGHRTHVYALPGVSLLPISVAMKKHEAEYLQALTTFCKPARQLCQVTWAWEEYYDDKWVPEAVTWLRNMDLTESVNFSLAIAEASLDRHMRQEVEFLGLFDRVRRHIDQSHDLRGSDLATLIVATFQNGGTLSSNRRKRFADRVQAHLLDAIEEAVQPGQPSGAPMMRPSVVIAARAMGDPNQLTSAFGVIPLQHAMRSGPSPGQRMAHQWPGRVGFTHDPVQFGI